MRRSHNRARSPTFFRPFCRHNQNPDSNMTPLLAYVGVSPWEGFFALLGILTAAALWLLFAFIVYALVVMLIMSIGFIATALGFCKP